jgi:hypothetical protein
MNKIPTKYIVLFIVIITIVYFLSGCFLLPNRYKQWKKPPLSKRYLVIKSNNAWDLSFNDFKCSYYKDTVINLPDTGTVCITLQAMSGTPDIEPYLEVMFMPDSISQKNTQFYGTIKDFCNK